MHLLFSLSLYSVAALVCLFLLRPLSTSMPILGPALFASLAPLKIDPDFLGVGKGELFFISKSSHVLALLLLLLWRLFLFPPPFLSFFSFFAINRRKLWYKIPQREAFQVDHDIIAVLEFNRVLTCNS